MTLSKWGLSIFIIALIIVACVIGIEERHYLHHYKMTVMGHDDVYFHDDFYTHFTWSCHFEPDYGLSKYYHNGVFFNNGEKYYPTKIQKIMTYLIEEVTDTGRVDVWRAK